MILNALSGNGLVFNSHIYAILFLVFILGCSQEPISSRINQPEALPDFKVVYGDSKVFDGYIFLRQIISPGSQLMINSSGEVVWFQISDSALFRPFTPYEESYVALKSDQEIHEISYTGDTINLLKYGYHGFDRKLHHELIKDRCGNYVSLTRETLPLDLSEVGGNANDTVRTDGIIVLSPSGQKLWHWSLDQVLDPMAFNGILNVKKDWGHANALYIDTDGNYLVSWRDFNAIWKINSQTGERMWFVDESTLIAKGRRFYKQHGVHRNQAGDILLFDNGDRRTRPVSRAYSLRDDEDKSLVYSVALPDSLFTFKQGSVYEIGNDLLLFSSTTTKKLIITDRSGNIVWMANSDHAFYRAYYLDKAFLKRNKIIS